MAVDTFMAYVGVYASEEDAEADYQAVKDLHVEAGLMDAYDAAVIARPRGRQGEDHQEARDADAGRRRARRRRRSGHRPRHRPVPVRRHRGGLLLGATAGGALLGAVAGHAAMGMSRHDLKELGEQLDAGQAGLIVVGVEDVGARIEHAMKKAEKLEKKQLKADNAAIEADAGSAES